MKNALALKISGVTALVSTSILGSVTAASAGNVGGCGLEPDGGTLENNAGICELVFDSAGTFTWSLPAGIADLYGVIVGGGGGAFYSQPSNGYAGEGGDVEFVDFTSWAADDTFTVAPGVGGDTASAGNGRHGGFSSVTINGSGPAAFGGDGAVAFGMVWGYCGVGIFGENTGAGTPGDPAAGEACIGGGPGIIPDTAVGAPLIFDGFTSELGHGGGVYVDLIHNPRIGEGANVRYQSGDDATIADPTGADGAVIFRYTAADANNATDSGSGSGSGSGSRSGSTNSLSFTGNDVPVAAIALTSVAIIAAGIGAVAFGRRRSRASR